MQKTDFRAARVAAGALLMLFLGAMYAWSYFKVALTECYPMWTQKDVTLNFTVMMSCFCLGGMSAGSLLKKIPKPLQIAFGAVLIAGGFVLTSFLPEDGEKARIRLYIFYGVFTGLGTGITYNAALSGIQPWFEGKTGRISGVLLMSMGFGSLLLGLLAEKLIELWGLFVTFRVFGGLTLLVLVGCAWTARACPHTAVSEKEAAGKSGEYSTREVARKMSFWLCFLWNFIISSGGMLVINSASSITLYYGMSAVIGLIVSVFNGLGRLSLGMFCDLRGWRKTLLLDSGCFLVAGCLLIAGEALSLPVIVLVGMLLTGMVYGGCVTLMVAMIRQLFGEKHYSGNLALLDLSLIPASVAGPMISAALFDASGNYRSTFLAVIVFAVLSIAVALPIKKP